MMNVERLQDIVNKMYLSAMLISVFVCARSVFAIGESPKHYDDLYGMPAEMTEQRIYTIDGWRVNATFDGGKATAVQYMRIVSINNDCLMPADLGDPDIAKVLARHDPGSIGWQTTSSGDDIKWLRNDRGVVAYQDAKWMMTVINPDHPPPWYIPSDNNQENRKQDSDRGMDRPLFDYSDHYTQLVKPILDKYGMRQHEIEDMAKSVIEQTHSLRFEELTFVNIDINTMPDGRHHTSVTYVIDASEIIESMGDDIVRRYDMVTVNFYPDAGLDADRAYLSRGTYTSSIRRSTSNRAAPNQTIEPTGDTRAGDFE